jgi:hypothetical protein
MEDEIGEMRNAYKVGRPRHRGEDNIQVNFKEIGCEDVNWINLVQD